MLDFNINNMLGAGQKGFISLKMSEVDKNPTNTTDILYLFI